MDDEPTRGLKRNRYAATISASGFASTDGVVVYTFADTGGCSGAQIIDAADLGTGQTRFGISRSALEAWIATLN